MGCRSPKNILLTRHTKKGSNNFGRYENPIKLVNFLFECENVTSSSASLTLSRHVHNQKDMWKGQKHIPQRRRRRQRPNQFNGEWGNLNSIRRVFADSIEVGIFYWQVKKKGSFRDYVIERGFSVDRGKVIAVSRLFLLICHGNDCVNSPLKIKAQKHFLLINFNPFN